MNHKVVAGVALAALAAVALAQEDRKAEVASLLVTLQSEKAVERSAAARTLGEIGPGAEEAVAGLQAALRDSELEVRQNAAQALGYIGPAAKPATERTAAWAMAATLQTTRPAFAPPRCWRKRTMMKAL